MDYEDMEKKIKEEHIHVAILCSPHNPCGRVWERWELEKAMEQRKIVQPTDKPISLTDDARYRVSIAAPVISGGDVSGCVALLKDDQHPQAGEVESKLLQTAATFLSQQLTM